MAEGNDYRQALTDKLIEQLEAGTAPWQKPWDAAQGIGRLPYNPTTEKEYRGANSLYLAMQGKNDPRWATYKQAAAEGWQVRKGEKGTLIEYWKMAEERPAVDDKGRPILGDDGKQKTVNVRLERPEVFRAVVFNAQQMDGVPELDKAPRKHDWNPVERAERILDSSGAKIHHDQNDRAFYSPSRDEIHLPPKGQFPDQAAYYSTALHELGHWTGHESRLKREFGGGFGSAEYAKEELRAELSSYFMADKLGIPHDPGQHAAYVKSWVSVLKEDKNEIFRAARDAEKITDYVLQLDRDRTRDVDQAPALAQGLRPHDIPDRGTPAYGALVRQSIAERNDSGDYHQLEGQVKQKLGEGARFGMLASEEPVRGVVIAESKHSFVLQTGEKEAVALHKLDFRQLPAVGQEIVVGGPLSDDPSKGRPISLVEPDRALATARTAPESALRPNDVPDRNTPEFGALVRESVDAFSSPDFSQLAGRVKAKLGEVERFAVVDGDQPARGVVIAESKHHFVVQTGEKEAVALHKMDFRQLPAVGQEVVAGGPLSDDPSKGRPISLVEPDRALATARTVLDVPFKEKEAAKVHGAKWDKEAKEWFVPPGTDLAPLAKWLPKPDQERPAPAPVRSVDERPAPDKSGERTVLAVPFRDKNEASDAGAKWDKGAKTWYAPPGADLAKLDKWLPKREVAQDAELKQNLDPKVEFAKALKAAGLELKDEPVMDGKLQRVPVAKGKAGNRDGAYVGYLDGKPSGHIQNFASGSKENWTMSGAQLSQEEQAQLAAQAQIVKQQRAAELSEQHAKASTKATAKFDRLPDAPPAGENAYLARKQVAAHGVKFDGEKLVVPVRDVDGKLWSVQSIPPAEGAAKMFEKGGRKSGNMHLIGEIKPGAEVLVAEGYATGASLHQATGKAVAVAFDSGNLDAVVGAIKARHPTSPIFIMGDNDKHAQQNVGVEKATAAAQKHQVGVAFPEFKVAGKLSDFNDLHVHEGLPAVKAQVEKALGQAVEQSRERATGVARQQLGEGAEVKQPGPNTRHTGEVLGVEGYHATQATSKRAAVVHQVRDLEKVPTPGQVVTVQYKNGRGQVADKEAEQQKQKQLSR